MMETRHYCTLRLVVAVNQDVIEPRGQCEIVFLSRVSTATLTRDIDVGIMFVCHAPPALHPVWLSGNTVVSIAVVTLRRARLVSGWVTVFGTEPGTQVYSA